MDDVTLAIECDADVSDDLARALTSATGAEVHQATKSSLDGSAETVLQIIQVALTAVAVVPAALAPYLGRNQVRRLKLTDPETGVEIEIENPTKEQCEQYWPRGDGEAVTGEP